KSISNINSEPLQGMNILLVEDNEINILVATKFLHRWGAEIDVAHNGVEALEMFDKHKHHLILMDLHMPVLDGEETTIRFRKQGVTVPIIAVTASILSNDHDRVIKSGVNDIVVKPFEPSVFLNAIMRHTEESYANLLAS